MLREFTIVPNSAGASSMVAALAIGMGTLIFAAVAILGSFAGASLAHRLAPGWIRRCFGFFVLAVAGLMIVNNFSRPT